MQTRRELLISTIAGLDVAALGIPRVRANEWRSQFSTLNFGVVSSENEADRIARYKAFVAYLEHRLKVPIKMHQATDYAGTIEALKARKLELARFGSAAYAQAWLITGGTVEPIVVEADSEGSVAYYSVIAVKADSPYRSIEDLKGKSLAFADPNSTSAFVAPSYFLRE
jgi:phosphonate transport system substrate-binding protein